METPKTLLPPERQLVLDRFVAACRADERVAAAFLGGSYAAGTADAHSDLDLDLITTDAAYDDFYAARTAFVGQLGKLVFLEDYGDGGVACLFFVLADGTEAELILGRQSQFQRMHQGPYRVLLERAGLLDGVVFDGPKPGSAEQRETTRRLIQWFWHDLSHHFLTPLARGQLWSAYGGLEDLRRTCVNLARLRQDFSVVADGYEKVEHALPLAQLAPLEATCCALEPEAMLQAARLTVRYYQDLAPALARMHDLPYPLDLDRLMSERLAQAPGA